MKKLLPFLLLIMSGCHDGMTPIFAQAPPPPPQPGRTYVASAYGSWLLYVYQGNPTTGESSLYTSPYNSSGSNVPVFSPGLPLAIDRSNANSETVTINTVQTCTNGVNNCFVSPTCNASYQLCLVNGTFNFLHSASATVQSGSYGLQEAINLALSQQGGTVLIDQTWGGNTGMITSARGSTAVVIQDNRSGVPVFYQWNGSEYVAQSTDGCSSSNCVTSLNSLKGDVAITAGTGIGVSASGQNIQISNTQIPGIQSINGDSTSTQTISGSGGISCSTTGGNTNCNYSGGAGSGTVGSGGPYNDGGYTPSTVGTSIQPELNSFTLPNNLAASTLQTAIDSTGAGNVTYVKGPQLPFTNSNNWQIIDDRPGVRTKNVTEYGAVCDVAQGLGTISQGSTTLTLSGNSPYKFVTSDGGTSSTAKWISMVFPASTTGGNPVRWDTYISSVSSSTVATLAMAAPYGTSGTNGWTITIGHDDNVPLQEAFNQAQGAPPNGFTVAFPSRLCWTRTQPVIYSGQTIAGNGISTSVFPGSGVPDETAGGLLGGAGFDTLSANIPGTGQSDDTAGARWYGGFSLWHDARIDATKPWTFNNNGTITTPTLLQRWAMVNSTYSNIPYGPGWIRGSEPYGLNAYGGVANTTASSTTICVLTGGTPPVGADIIFAYLTGGLFRTTVASGSPGACAFGTGVLLTAAPSVTATHTEFMYGEAPGSSSTGTAIQEINTAIPSTGRTWPIQISLVNTIQPEPGAQIDVAPFGMVQIDNEQFYYYGTSRYPALNSQSFITLTSSVQNGTGSTGDAHNIGAPIVPLNPFQPTWPWPFNASALVANVTSFSITSDVATFTASNNFVAGDLITPNGFSSPYTYFNGHTFTILSTGLSSTQFEFNIAQANVSTTSVTTTATLSSPIPTNAEFWPGINIGNCSFAQPMPDGASGPPQGFYRADIGNVAFQPWPLAVVNTTEAPADTFAANNSTCGMYLGPGEAFDTHFHDLLVAGQYGIMEGPPLIHTVNWQGVPTADSNHWDNIAINAAIDYDLIGGGGNSLKDFQLFSQNCGVIGPFSQWAFCDGSVGAGFVTPQHLVDTVGFPQGTYIGASESHYWTIGGGFYLEAEMGDYNEKTPMWEFDGDHANWLTSDYTSGGPFFVGGYNNIFGPGMIKSQPFIPLFNYGSSNSFSLNDRLNSLSGSGGPPLSQTWPNSSFYDFGSSTQASASTQTADQRAAMGVLAPAPGQTNETFTEGNLTAPFVNTQGGLVGADKFAMSTGSGTVVSWTKDLDPTNLTQGYQGCVVGTTPGIYCTATMGAGYGQIAIGPGQQVAAGLNRVVAGLRLKSGSPQTVRLIVSTSCGFFDTHASVPLTTSWQNIDFGVENFSSVSGCKGPTMVFDGANTSAAEIDMSYMSTTPVPNNPIVQQITLTNGATIGGGTADPTGSCVNSSIYINSAGASGHRQWQCQGTSWVDIN